MIFDYGGFNTAADYKTGSFVCQGGIKIVYAYAGLKFWLKLIQNLPQPEIACYLSPNINIQFHAFFQSIFPLAT